MPVYFAVLERSKLHYSIVLSLTLHLGLVVLPRSSVIFFARDGTNSAPHFTKLVLGKIGIVLTNFAVR